MANIISKARKSLNDLIRKSSNRICSGLGDILTSEIMLVRSSEPVKENIFDGCHEAIYAFENFRAFIESLDPESIKVSYIERTQQNCLEAKLRNGLNVSYHTYHLSAFAYVEVTGPIERIERFEISLRNESLRKYGEVPQFLGCRVPIPHPVY